MIAWLGIVLVGWRLVLSGPTLDAPCVWLAEGLASEPTVQIVGGQGGLVACVDDGAATLRCTAFAQGPWRQVIIDGVVIARRWQVGMPMLAHGGMERWDAVSAPPMPRSARP